MSHRRIPRRELNRRAGRTRTDLLSFMVQYFLGSGELPSVETIANHLTCAQSTVYAFFDRCEDLNWFQRGKVDRYQGRWPMNTYDLNPRSDLARYIEQIRADRSQRRSKEAALYLSSANQEAALTAAQTYEAGRKAGQTELRRQISLAKSRRSQTPSPTFGANLYSETRIKTLSVPESYAERFERLRRAEWT